MNILFFSRLFYPHIGGVEKHVLEVSRILLKKGHKITVVTEDYTKGLRVREDVQGISVYRIPNLREGKIKKFQIWKWLWINRTLIKETDIVHCHDVFFWYLPFRFLFPFKKIFTTFHGYEGYPVRLKSIFMHRISEKLSMGNICIGDFIKKWYGTKPTYVAYGGANEIKNEKLKINNEESAIFIGRLEEETGILTYTKAVEIIKKKIQNFDFLVIGDGSLKAQVSKKIKVLNPVTNILEYLQNYNFAFVSGYLSILEAMAAKKLVFSAYDNPLKEDYLRQAPFSKFILISSSPLELVSKMSFYLDNPKAGEKLTEKAYEWVKKCTWDEMVNTYLKLWKL
jgi:glycosyltransferase involved in cell wall biosynthesis